MIDTTFKLSGKCTDIRYPAYCKYKCNRDSCLLCSEVNSSILELVGLQDLCIWDDSSINGTIRELQLQMCGLWEVGAHMRVRTHQQSRVESNRTPESGGVHTDRDEPSQARENPIIRF